MANYSGSFDPAIFWTQHETKIAKKPELIALQINVTDKKKVAG
jgi:hypothetical protein